MSEENVNVLEIGAAVAPVLENVNGTPVLTRPYGWETQELDELRDAPLHVKSCINMTDLDSFMDYLNIYKEETTIVKLTANRNGLSARGVIDFHQPPDELRVTRKVNTPKWGNHRVAFEATTTPAFYEWRNANGKYMSQSDFANFIHDNSIEIVDPPGADLLEIVKTLKALSKGTFKSMKDDHDGSIDMVMNVKVSAQGGTSDKPLHLPKTITLRMVPYYGFPPVDIKADLKFRIPKDDHEHVTFAYKLYRLDDVLEKVFNEAAELLKSGTSLPVYRCS